MTVYDSDSSVNMINGKALEARAYVMHTSMDIRAFNSFYRMASSYITEKYRITSGDGWNDSGHSNKIWWKEKINGEMVTSDNVSVGEFIIKSLESWNPERGVSYTGWVYSLLKTYHHLVPVTTDVRKLNRKYSDMYTKYARLKKDDPKLTFASFVNEICSYLSVDKRTELIMIHGGEASLDAPIDGGDSEDEDITLEDTVESEDSESEFEGSDKELLEEIEEFDEIIRTRVKTRKSVPKAALFFTVVLIKKYFTYFDFSYYRNLIEKHECISDRIDELETFYERRRGEGKDKNRDLFPNQKEQAEMLGITNAAYNQLLNTLKTDSEKS